MSKRNYAKPLAGLPNQSEKTVAGAVFDTAYVYMPARVQSDIVTTRLPHWEKTRAWIIARPLSGFAETFAQYMMEISPGGGSNQPEPDKNAEGVLFVVDGYPTLTLDDEKYELSPGSYVFISPHSKWELWNKTDEVSNFHWIRKEYQFVDGIEVPTSYVTHDDEVEPIAMPDTNGRWATTRFVDPDDVSHDMHVTIVTLYPGATIPFQETHVMEHGLYVLEGKGVYQLNKDWIEVEPGDFMWLRAFCPQAAYAGGDGPFRYLLYKDMHRHPAL